MGKTFNKLYSSEISITASIDTFNFEKGEIVFGK